MAGGWTGVDLDGCLAMYEGWQGPGHIGEPVPLMLERVKRWLAEGVDVRIFTARVSVADQADEVRAALGDWCEQNGLPRLPVTHQKDYAMVVLYDDRCVQVETNTGRLIGEPKAVT